MTLNQRAAQALAGRWRAGMLDAATGDRCIRGGPAPYWATTGDVIEKAWPGAETVPDMTDPATLGAYLAVVREAWGALVYLAPTQIDPHTFGWVVCSAGLRAPVNPRCEGATEAEALVAALEAAPR